MFEKTIGESKDREILLEIYSSPKYLGLDGIIGLLKAHEKILIALLYLLLICVAYAPVVFSGRSLQLSDLYYPGWEAYVDGRSARLYRVDGVIRGVFVQEGGIR